MSELREILAAYARLCARGEHGVLASVVHARGSTYRRAGARLLLLPDDTMHGLIGGGCLEGDLLLRAREVRADGVARLQRYDASAAGDVLWGLGSGCAGTVDVLLQRVGRGAPGPLDTLARWRETRTRGALGTVIAGPRIGAHSALDARDFEVRGLRAPHIEHALRAVRAQEDGARVLHWEHAGERGVVEPFAPPLRLLIFGAGPDAAPLAAHAHALDWDVEVFDARETHAQPARFPGARVHCCAMSDAIARAAPDADAYCVLMTHHYEHDRVLLRDARRTRAPYIALLGPRARCEDLLADLRAEENTHARDATRAEDETPSRDTARNAGDAARDEEDARTHDAARDAGAARGLFAPLVAEARAFTHRVAARGGGARAVARRFAQLFSSRAPHAHAERARIFSPAGLDLGADAPEEIALAIVAEVLAVSNRRAGGALRERVGPIHDNPERG